MTTAHHISKRRSSGSAEDDGLGPGMDLMMALVTIIIGILALTQWQKSRLDGSNKVQAAELDGIKKQLEVEKNISRLAFEAVSKLNKEIAVLKKRDNLSRDIASETKTNGKTLKLSFQGGHYELPSDLAAHIRGPVIDDILKILGELRTDSDNSTNGSDLPVDTIEIIGHTDDARLGNETDGKPNKAHDDDINAWLASRRAVIDDDPLHKSNAPPIKAASNAELGFLRAVNVMFFLQEELKDRLPKEFAHLKFRCYSAGQTVLPSAVKPTGFNYEYKDEDRRRIEFRFTKTRGIGMLDEGYMIINRPSTLPPSL